MLEWIISFIPLLSLPIGFLGAYLALKKFKNDLDITEYLDDLLVEISDNTDMQKRLYLIGGLVGQGIKSGVGLNVKGGKMKMDDIATQLLGGFANMLMQGMAQKQAQNQPQTGQQGVIGEPLR